MSLKPIIAYGGSKRKLLKYILPLFSEHKTYVEPFIGGGAVYFAKHPSEIEVISDLNSTLIDFYTTIRDTSYFDISDEPILDSIEAIQNRVNLPTITPTDKVIKYITLMCNGIVCGNPTKKVSRNINPMKKMKIIEKYTQRLKNTHIFNLSYQHIIEKYDSEETLFYLDPPYQNSKSWYSHNKMDYVELKNILDKIKGRFILSINDSPEIRELFKDYYIRSITVKLSGGMRPGRTFLSASGSATRDELIIWNDKH